MIYRDELYGAVRIGEPVLQALLASRGMMRLQGIHQHGITAVLGLTKPITRYEHSVGAMLLVRRWGADVREQIAALLHDVSHTIFSHVIDHALGEADTQSYHDRVKLDYVSRTDIPAILQAHGFAVWQELLREEDFGLLEQPAPALCADRVDYFLRDGVALGLVAKPEVAMALDNMTVRGGRVVFTDVGVARWFAQQFMAADEASWSNFHEVGLYEICARVIRRALAVGGLTEDDFWLTDEVAWGKLQRHADVVLQEWLGWLKRETQFVEDEARPHFWVRTKIRTLDPAVWRDGEMRLLSQWDADYAAERKAYLARRERPWPMRVVGMPL